MVVTPVTEGVTVMVLSERIPKEREKRVDLKGDASPDRIKEKWILLNVTDAPLTRKREFKWLSILETDFVCIPSEFFG